MHYPNGPSGVQIKALPEDGPVDYGLIVPTNNAANSDKQKKDENNHNLLCNAGLAHRIILQDKLNSMEHCIIYWTHFFYNLRIKKMVIHLKT